MLGKNTELEMLWIDPRGLKCLNTQSRWEQPWRRTGIFPKPEARDRGPELRVGRERRSWRFEEGGKEKERVTDRENTVGRSSRIKGPFDLHGRAFPESAVGWVCVFADYMQVSGVGADRLSVGVDRDLSFARQVQWRQGRQETGQARHGGDHGVPSRESVAPYSTHHGKAE